MQNSPLGAGERLLEEEAERMAKQARMSSKTAEYMHATYHPRRGLITWAINDGRTGSDPTRVDLSQVDALRSFIDTAARLAPNAELSFYREEE